MQKVLLIDDDGKLAEALGEYCVRFDIQIEPALTPSSGLNKLSRDQYDAVILDVMLPEMNGFEVCKRIRQESDIPIIMLTARGDVTDRIVGLEIGADDYLPKPFDPRELVARLQVNINRHARLAKSTIVPADTELYFDGLSLNLLKREVVVGGSAVELTTMEFSLLQLLSESPGTAFSRDQILSVLKGTENELFSRSVDILVSRLRAKLKPLLPIRTLHGAGYAFVLPVAEPPGPPAT
ncbi:response regulator transcription factor [Granulosicoccus antarcticus]|uniref:Transcriptional regulatory protein OmpR n=1 Tax=Granulosicoccus antarcticus IMCC3135 TaxID=1192854 RepID=A0A2Z2NJ52_9GAMM|nr:response regulator transcription factor [Granulosicoccus antarcticus]ASJ71386.1 Transcriptional regulatory protein OmpR [Granulosicoccus antarcticus IMCC3135]